MSAEQPISEQEKRVWELQEAIVAKLNTDEVLSRRRTGVRIAHHVDGPEIWEMILNKDGQWPGVNNRSGVEPVLDDLLECFARLRYPEFIRLRKVARTPEEFNGITRSFIEANKPVIISDFLRSMEGALVELT